MTASTSLPADSKPVLLLAISTDALLRVYGVSRLRVDNNKRPGGASTPPGQAHGGCAP
jgi:hypothetical protein